MKELQAWTSFRPWQRHSLVLMVGGLSYIAIGVSFLTLDEMSVRRSISLYIALVMAPWEVWGWCFVGAGSLSCLSSRWPTFSDRWGYAVLCSLSSAMSAMYILGFFLGPAPMSNLTSGFVWGLIAFMWWAVSGLVNPEEVSTVVMPNGAL